MISLTHMFDPVNGKEYNAKGWTVTKPESCRFLLEHQLSHGGVGARRIDLFLQGRHYLLQDHGRETLNLPGPTDPDIVSIRIEERGRNTGNHFRYWFEGPLQEMSDLLFTLYYLADSYCAEPPADYKMNPEVREQLRQQAVQYSPLRELIRDLLGKQGVQVVDVPELGYYERAALPSYVSCMCRAGVKDAATILLGVVLAFSDLSEICDYMRVFEMSFTEARDTYLAEKAEKAKKAETKS